MLAGYFDESGTSSDSDVTMIGGLVADTVDWFGLARPWKQNLATTRVSWFHATDCENGWGEFEGIGEPFRQALVWGLSDALGQLKAQCFGAVMRRQDWQHAPADIRSRCEDEPFYFCVELCLQQICNWAKVYAPGQRVAVTFAKHETFQAHTAKLYDLYLNSRKYDFHQLGALDFRDPRDCIPLQAADLVTYEIYRHSAALGEGLHPIPFRRALERFETRAELAMHAIVHDRDSLAQLKPRRL